MDCISPKKEKKTPTPLSNCQSVTAVQLTVHFAAAPEQRIPASQRANRESLSRRKNICLHSKAEGVLGAEDAVHAAMRGAAKPGADSACGLGTERPHAFSRYTLPLLFLARQLHILNKHN